MSNNPFEQKSTFENPSLPATPPKKSGMSKVLIILGSIFGVIALCCCGGIVYSVFWIRGAFITDPTLVKEKANQIVSMEYPSEFSPIFAMDVSILKMAMFVSGSQSRPEGDMLMVMSVPDDGNVSVSNMTAQMEAQMKQQSAKNPNAHLPQLDIIERGTRNYMVRGTENEFQFNSAKDAKSGELFYQVAGVLRDSAAKRASLVFFQVRQSKFSEERLKQIIESIK